MRTHLRGGDCGGVLNLNLLLLLLGLILLAVGAVLAFGLTAVDLHQPHERRRRLVAVGRLVLDEDVLGVLTAHQLALGLALHRLLVHDGLEVGHLPRLPPAGGPADRVPVGDGRRELRLAHPLQPFLEDWHSKLEAAGGIQVAEACEAQVAADELEEGVGGLAAHGCLMPA